MSNIAVEQIIYLVISLSVIVIVTNAAAMYIKYQLTKTLLVTFSVYKNWVYLNVCIPYDYIGVGAKLIVEDNQNCPFLKQEIEDNYVVSAAFRIHKCVDKYRVLLRDANNVMVRHNTIYLENT